LGSVFASSGGESSSASPFEAGIPVILLPSAGGQIQLRYDELRHRMDLAYSDSDLRSVINEVNDEAKNVAPDGLAVFARQILPGRIENVLRVLMGAARQRHRPAGLVA
jgi:hypothetical protein